MPRKYGRGGNYKFLATKKAWMESTLSWGKGIVLREDGNGFIFYHRGTEVTEFPQRFIFKAPS